MAIKVCFLGGARYSRPLDTSSEKKFRAMKSLGDIFVIGFSEDLRPQQFTEHAQFYMLPNLPLPVLRYLEIFVLGLILSCWLIFRYGIRVFVAQSPYEGAVAALSKKIAGWFGRKVLLIVESHGDFEESLFLQRRILLPRLYRLIMLHAARFALKHADSLRAVSNSTGEQLRRWVPEKPAFQFVAWTDMETFLKAGAERNGQLSQDILYAGLLIPRKGIHHLVKAFIPVAQDFPQARLVIAGPEENRQYAAQLKAQAKQLGLNGRVHFVDELSRVALAARMQQSCVLVLPTYSEGLPRVVYEAMAVGLPVIATAVSGIPEIVQHNVTGFLVPPGDENALSEKIRWILDHPVNGNEMGCRARNFAERFFSTEAYVAGYRELFDPARALI